MQLIVKGLVWSLSFQISAGSKPPLLKAKTVWDPYKTVGCAGFFLGQNTVFGIVGIAVERVNLFVDPQFQKVVFIAGPSKTDGTPCFSTS